MPRIAEIEIDKRVPEAGILPVVKKTSRAYELIKRLFDVVVSLLLLLVTLPITLPVAIAIKLNDGGSVIHKRTCLGKNGRTYAMYKFRTMVMDADNLERWLTPEQMEEYRTECKLERDPRITKLGRFLRKTSIDELPQLLSVLHNDMSLIGPRPIVASERHHYTDEEFDLLMTAKPGLTGYWQVNGRSDSTYESGKRQELELYYAVNRSLILDFKILFKTISVVVRGGGGILAHCVLRGWIFRFLKRTFDLIVSGLALLVLSPLLLFVALFIKMGDGGEVIHTRICEGANGRQYKMYKFRTMVMDADNLERWLTPEQMEEYRTECKLEHDPRITRIGSILRKTSIDELPQLLSVLHNDMSLIGPRPVVSREADSYGVDKKTLLSVKSGITGWWQVKARSSIPFLSDEAKELQLYYANNQSLILDIKILFMTVAVVLKRTGAK